MKVWNMYHEQFVEFEKWMRWCPWVFMTTTQREQLENE